MKINCLIQSVFGCLPICDAGLNQDVNRICTIGSRIAQCLSAYLSIGTKGFTAVYNALILAKGFKVRLWENSKHVSRQIERIGSTLSNILVNAGLTTFDAICRTNPRELELILNRNPPFGSNVIDFIVHLPVYRIVMQQVGGYASDSACVVFTVSLANVEELKQKCTTPNHSCTLLVGDAENKVLVLQEIMDKQILKMGKWTKKLEVRRSSKGDQIRVRLISNSYVGLDSEESYKPMYSGMKRPIQNIDSEEVQRRKSASLATTNAGTKQGAFTMVANPSPQLHPKPNLSLEAVSIC